MKHKILTLLLALVASVGSLFAQITIDGSFSDWDQVPAAQLAQASGDYVAYNAKLCADAEYIYFYAEYDGDMTMDISIYMNTTFKGTVTVAKHNSIAGGHSYTIYFYEVPIILVRIRMPCHRKGRYAILNPAIH